MSQERKGINLALRVKSLAQYSFKRTKTLVEDQQATNVCHSDLLAIFSRLDAAEPIVHFTKCDSLTSKAFLYPE
jgi:hypothetical protein